MSMVIEKATAPFEPTLHEPTLQEPRNDARVRRSAVEQGRLVRGSKHGVKVDFIILGAQKCATTTLFDTLALHPRLVGSSDKEPHFFSKGGDWRHRVEEYHRLFTPRPDALYFEGSTGYTFYPHQKLEIWKDLHAYNPALKFIYVVRDPVDRIVSAYVHNAGRGHVKNTLDRTLRTEPIYMDISRYYLQIKPFVETFGRENVLLLEFNDLIRQRRATMAKVMDFLGLDLEGLGDFEHVHTNAAKDKRLSHRRFDLVKRWSGGLHRKLPQPVVETLMRLTPTDPEKPDVPPEVRRYIQRLLETDIRQLEVLMQRDFTAWLADIPGPVTLD